MGTVACAGSTASSGTNVLKSYDVDFLPPLSERPTDIWACRVNPEQVGLKCIPYEIFDKVRKRVTEQLTPNY